MNIMTGSELEPDSSSLVAGTIEFSNQKILQQFFGSKLVEFLRIQSALDIFVHELAINICDGNLS